MLIKESRSRDKLKLVRSCQFMRHQFLVRVAKVINNLENLPYIILTNDDIKRVLDLYIYAFTGMLQQPAVKNMGDVDEFNRTLSGLLEDLQDIIHLLSKGIHESQEHFENSDFPITIKKTMDYIVLSRMRNRVLVRHHLSMHMTREGYISVINTELSLKQLIKKNVAFAANVCQSVYTESLPEVLIDGHTEAKIAFIPNIIDYVLREVIKNAFRATVEAHLHKYDKPPIICTICNEKNHWFIRVSDRGTGMDQASLRKMTNYCYTSFKQESNYSDAFGELLTPANTDHGSTLAGFGVGIPVSKAYVEFMEGTLDVHSMPGIGTDVYICIPQLSTVLDDLKF